MVTRPIWITRRSLVTAFLAILAILMTTQATEYGATDSAETREDQVTNDGASTGTEEGVDAATLSTLGARSSVLLVLVLILPIAISAARA